MEERCPGAAGAGPLIDPAESADPALSYAPVTFYQRCGKRLFDLAGAAAGLILLSPLFLLVALAIKLDSPGPVFYVSTRLGRRARPFPFVKFRSMVRDAEARRAQLEALNEMDGPVFKIREDPRMTRVGRLLRRSSLDELPQLWSVLRGQMSFVGPRPPIPAEVERYERRQRRRLAVTPGITCLWQIRGRNRIGFEEWMRLDAEYIDRISFGLDLKILLLTLPAVLKGEGAS
ncbi:MAG: sugar transferase [Candidatus Eisenbacteria bacterium]|uniref:Sugar transferase n=1 Tax=Eiseniibacteriota bacterium TaxID=2212470 RepID=A0A937X9S0_UNCEI|nr:sugar transferase [Candidatus Eisenbacteria bacterium]